jgi:lysophospholipase L1-like esterase
VKTLFAFIVAAAVVAAGSTATGATAPTSIAALGDSITRGFDTCSLPYTDCVANSWSTGTNASVNSWYQRLLVTSPAIRGRNYNDAKTGAKMADLAGQATTAVTQKADVVTILMGANDVCTSTVGAMTDPTTLGNQLRTALTTITSGSPTSQVYVTSIPNVYHLWEIFRTNLGANFVWGLAGICQSLLANPRSTSAADQARRAQVGQRTIDDNAAIAQVCAQFAPRCRYDNGAAYNLVFTTSDVTTRDYFHPSVSGQAKAAAVTWGAFFGP